MIKAKRDLGRLPVVQLMVFGQQEDRFPLNPGMLHKPDLICRLVSAADVATAIIQLLRTIKLNIQGLLFNYEEGRSWAVVR